MNDTEKRDRLELLRQQTALARFGELALKSDDLDEILSEACHLVAEALETELAKVMELQEDGKILRVRAGIGWKPGVVGVATVKMGADTSEVYALEAGEPVISPDIEKETRFRYPPLLTGHGVRAFVNVLILGGKGKPPFGLLQVDSRQPRRFTDDDIAFLRSYANLIAAAVDRLRIVGDVRHGEARLRLALDAAELGGWELDLISGATTRTLRHDQIFGYAGSSPAWSYDIFLSHVLPEDRHQVSEAFRTATDGRSEWHCQCRIRRASDGAIRWIDVHGRAQDTHGSGRPSRLIGIVADVTERKQNEEALRASEEFNRRVLQSSGDCIKVLDLDANLIFMSEGGQHVMEVSDFNAIRGCPWPDFWQNEKNAEAKAAVEAAKAGGVGRFQGLANTMAGTPKWWDVQVTPILGADGRPEKLLSVSRDITATQRAVEALRESQSLNTLILGSNRDCIVVLDLEGHTQFLSPGGIESMEVSDVEAVLGLSWLRVWKGADHDAACAAVAEACAGGTGRFEGFCPTHKGAPKWWDIVISPLPGPDGKPERLVSVGRDITERKLAEEQLHRLNATLEQQVAERTADLAAANQRMIEEMAEREQAQAEIIELYNRAPIPLHSVDAEIRLLSVSDRWLQFMGYSDRAEVLGRKVADFLTEESARRQREEVWPMVLRGGEFFEVEYQFARKNGDLVDVLLAVVVERDSAGNLNRTISGLIDISARKRAEEQLRQSQKMEAVGQLTGGIAHDFNNLLTSISGSLELLQMSVSAGKVDSLERYIAIAEAAATRAAALTHRLLAFSRRQTLDPKPVNPNRLILGMDELIRRTVGPAITVETVLAAGLWPTLCDPNQLENALLNLCINARDAMPDGGRLVIETANMWLDDRAAREREMAAGQYVALCVSDAGTGMTPKVIARAFDPFFTTKPTGTGTGLGLSMIYGFAQQSGGQIRIYSEIGVGTTMRLYLPRHRGEVEENELPAQHAAVPRAKVEKTVLVVDDEPGVRMLASEVLENLGYTVIEAADGATGLQMLQSNAQIDLLVTDVGLPGGMNGRQMADAARELRPDLKVLFITGYAENAVLSHGHLEPGMHVLTKPFALEALASRIGDLLSVP